MNIVVVDIRDALKSFSRRPLRSLLSSLGIGIGVTALITMLSISEGAKERAEAKIRSLGTGNLRIESLGAGDLATSSRMNLSQGLQVDDGRRIAAWLGTRGVVGTYVKKEAVPVQFVDRTIQATVLGVNSDWFTAEKVQASSGRLLSENDILHNANFCVAGSRIVEALQLKPGEKDITIQIGNFASTLVGTLRPEGRLLTEGTGLSSLDFDTTILLPLSSTPYARQVADRSLIDGMVISLAPEMNLDVIRVATQVEAILDERHHGVQDYIIVVPYTLLEEVRENQRVFSLIMGIIAGLSLVVGGIGVMNVMLANIAEQTREIGLRMAVGASKGRIVALFLWNSVLLTLLGSVWGIVTGIGLSLVVQHYAGWEVVFSSFSIIVAPASAIVTGVIFGLHPALRAAALDPAHALRDS